MFENRTFLKWLLINALIGVGTFILYWLGAFHELMTKDASYFGVITLILFYITAGLCGWATWQVEGIHKYWGRSERLLLHDIEKIRKSEEVIWFVSEICLVLGMGGTIIGFIMMLSGFETLDISNVNTIQLLLGQLGRSMATALYTTLVGLMCGSLLKTMNLNLSMALTSRQKEIEND